MEATRIEERKGEGSEPTLLHSSIRVPLLWDGSTMLDTDGRWIKWVSFFLLIFFFNFLLQNGFYLFFPNCTVSFWIISY